MTFEAAQEPQRPEDGETPDDMGVSRFGDPEVDAIHRRAKELLRTGKFFRFVRTERSDDGSASIVMCGLWRIDRSAKGAFSLFEHDLATGEWKPTKDPSRWPSIPLMPVRMAQSLSWWEWLLTDIIATVLNGAGYNSLPADKRGRIPSDATSPTQRLNTDLPAGLMECNLRAQHHAMMRQSTMIKGAKSLRAALYDIVIRGDVASLAMKMGYELYHLPTLLTIAVHNDAALKVARERPNLLPMLKSIHPKHWSRTDLFAERTWIRGDRRSTIVDRKGFASGQGVKSFSSGRAFRFLSKRSATFVEKWRRQGHREQVLVDLSDANLTQKIPAIGWTSLAQVSFGFGLSRVRARRPEAVPQIIRIYAAHLASTWEDDGFEAVREATRRSMREIPEICDWLAAVGIDQGFPMRNSTYPSLLERSTRWHLRPRAQLPPRPRERYTWTSVLDRTEIDGCTFEALTSTDSLDAEADELQHCVHSYGESCASGVYRVFSCKGPGDERSTLGILRKAGGKWVVEQHHSARNGRVSQAAAEAGAKLASMYSQEAKKAAKTAAA